MKYEFFAEHGMSENICQLGRGGERFGASTDGPINAARGDAVGLTCREEVENSSPDFCRALLDYLEECAGMVDAGCFSAMAADDENFIMYDWNISQCDSALDIWKRDWELQRK